MKESKDILPAKKEKHEELIKEESLYREFIQTGQQAENLNRNIVKAVFSPLK